MLLLTCSGEAATYHVNSQDPSSSDGNPGTAAQPWRTFKKGLMGIRSGDTLYIHEGIYRVTDRTLDAQWLNPGVSGTQGNPTIIQTYPGDTPQIYLSERVTSGWINYQGSTWKRPLPRNMNADPPRFPPEMVAVVDPNNPAAPPLALLKQVNSLKTSGVGNWGGPGSVQPLYSAPVLPPQYKNDVLKQNQNDMTAGDFYYDLATQELYVWLPDGSDPNTGTLELGLSQAVRFLGLSWIELRGLE